MARKLAKVRGVYEKNPGSGVWYVQYIQSGVRVRKQIGAREDAVEYLSKVRYIRSTDDGVVPTTAKIAAKTTQEMEKISEGTTVGDLLDDFEKYIKAHPEEYRDQRNPPIRIRHLKAAFGNREADSLQPHEISDWLDSLKKKTSSGRKGGLGLQTSVKASGATANRLKTTLSAAYKRGLLYRKVKTNPARDVKQRRVSGGVIRFLSPAEETRLRAVLQREIDACGPHQEQQRKRVIHRVCELDVALGTGMRQGEQYGLLWTDVDFHREIILIRQTKNGTPREVHMIDDVVKALRKLQELQISLPASTDGAVFCIAGPNKWWGTALRSAKVEKFRWHDLRHTFCSRLAQSGASLKVIQEAAGHKTIAMSARYAHLDKSSLRSAMSVLNRAT